MQLVNRYANLKLFGTLELELVHCNKYKKEGEMLFKLTLDLHVIKSLFLKVFVNEYSYLIQYFYLDSRSRSRGTF